MSKCLYVLPVLLAVCIGAPPGLKCGPGRFTCGDARCILRRYVCDGVNTCGTKYDESVCSACSPDAFRCDGNRCVRNVKRCDGYTHCNDGSDEKDCGTIDPASLFICNNGQQIRAETYCDGEPDCSDGSDESNCTHCQRDAVFCDGFCKPSDFKCDGYYHCTNGIDEVNCTDSIYVFAYKYNVTCRKDQFNCITNQCIDMKFKCDGVNDCDTGIDEVNCTECAPNAFKCDGKCQRDAIRCDGEQFCMDGKDEENCPEINPLYEFICNDGTTRRNTTRCDGVFTCPNGEDEDDCYSEMCQGGSYFCAGGCRPAANLCNGIIECPPGGEDEINCPGFKGEEDLYKTCGRAVTGPSSLVVNGQKAELGAFPWHAALYRLKDEKICDDYQYICGASLITKDVLITAAHCFFKGTQKLDAKYFAVALGKIYSDWFAEEIGEFHNSKVKSIHISPVYRGVQRKYADDIALIVMEKPAVLGKHIATICLDPAIKLSYRESIHVVGWGYGLTPLQELEAVQLPYEPFDACVDELENNPIEISFLTYDKFCSPLEKWSYRAPGLARGDSGGGAVVLRGDSWTLVGIISISLSEGRLYGFTNISHHFPWITRNVASDTRFVQN